MTPRSRFRAPRAALARVLALLVLLPGVLACGPGSVVPTPPPDATASAVPPATATPAPPTATPAPTFPLSVTDDEGTTVAIPSRPEHIVALTPAATETLFAIGAGDRVVAKVEDITPYPPEADDLPVVATFQGVDVEQIVALDADLVIAGGLFFTPPDAIAQLRSLDVPVVVLYATSIDAALAGIDLIGEAAGEAAAATELTARMRTEIDDLAASVAGMDAPTTFYEIDATQKIYTVPEHSLYAEMLTLAGADPITTDDSYEISLETLVAADPEVILLGDGGYTTPADVVARPGWGGISAVTTGRITAVDDTLITRPGPRLVDGLRDLIAALHPDAAG